MRSRVIATALSALLLLGPAGCSGDEPEPPSGGEASQGASTSAEASASPSADAVVPASGPLLVSDPVLTLRVPGGEGWNVIDGSLTASYRVDGGFFDVGGGEYETGDRSLEEAMEIEMEALAGQSDYPRYRHTGNRVIKGVEVWVIEARRKDSRLYQIAGVHQEYAFRVKFAWPPSFTGAEELREQILASLEWQ